MEYFSMKIIITIDSKNITEDYKGELIESIQEGLDAYTIFLPGEITIEVKE